ncbi:putative Flagellar hook-associated protein FlgK [uncultured Pleomorphomonas sp.]|uniref:Flagellar hook-associated protein 1 n=2 Tax=Pleomorphomonas TaxID=261933 RepID=A0A2G9X1B8_9HYPH|nr:flagellar hook-associated protein FlgK [Pleomorphomonas carboxyditropha]PIP00767.1 flagellar hook-associated protein FlgK [Pleomorphomonas carboxyditropha]SCM72603.1 putative Flagellar hook-associated protein FlgK [uncultured Pleomorphomonas sp.]
MPVSSALSTALSGIRTTQQQLGVTSANIANAKSTGYSRQTISSTAQVANSRVYGVEANQVTREINLLVQKQWRTSQANSAYADTRVTALSALDSYWGAPNSSSSLNSIYGDFSTTLQKLATTPNDTATQGSAVSAAQNLVSRLNQLSGDVQSLRQEAESNIANAVSRVNALLSTIADLDKQVVAVGAGGTNSTSALQDKRDAAIDELSEYMDIHVTDQPGGGIAISLTDGTQLYDDVAVTLSFDQQGVVDASRVYSTEDSQRSLGTIRISSGPGSGVDLFKSGSIRSGKIAAYKELRDETLVNAQAQLDTIAATLSKATSTRQASGTAVGDATTAGYTLDISGLTEGNTLKVEYTDASGAKGAITFVAYKGGTAPGNGFTPEPGDTVVGIDLTSATDVGAQIANALNAATGGSDFSGSVSTSGSTSTVSLSATTVPASHGSITSVVGEISSGEQDGYQAYPLFVDGSTGKAYTGLTNGTDTITGLAARISVNPKVVADPSLTVKYGSDTLSGDGTRPQAILDALDSRVYSYSASIGIGSATTPFKGTFEGLLSQVVNTQGALVEDAQNVADGQSVVTSNLKERYDNSRSVDLDTELMALIQLQTSYSANARVLSVAQELMDTLMNTFK